tara:strand:+ start:7858 stop:10515 length:2658 start_codon:yes stop_codon:yes gene_type:complete
MATTQNLYTGNGSTTNYSFTFEYLKQEDVKVTLNTVATTAFTFANATTLAFTSAPANSVAIRIFRDTNIDAINATFFPGSAIKAEDLNSNFTQNQFATQETDNEVIDANTTAASAVTTANAANTKSDAAVTTANTASTNASAAVATSNTASTNATNAVNTANTASTNATTAVNTANAATTTANGAVTTANAATATANTASTNASAAVTTSNTANTTAGNAVTTSNTANTAAGNAVTTANTASTNATNAVTTANGAVTTANTANTNASAAVVTANTASTNATTAVNTANAATATANTAGTNATAAVATANTASTNASSAVTTANAATANATAALTNSRESDGSGGFTSAISKANTAITTANAASAAVSSAVLFTLITNVAAIPGSPSNNDYVEVGNSTGIQSFSPLSGLPAGFVGASGLTVRITFNSSASSWVFMSYFANDSEDRYFQKTSGNTNTTNIATKLPLAGGTLTGALTLSGNPTAANHAANKSYVDTEVVGIVDSAPGTLDTLNKLAAALGDDANFSTTVLPLAGGTMTGNIVMSGSETVDGRDLSADGSKLDGIESNATADQTAAEIRSLVESASDSNVFTDADHSKLNGIASGAQVNVATNLGKSTASTSNTITSSTGSDVTINEATGSAAGLMSTTHHNKLDGIESGATADQTAAQILTAIKTVDGSGSGLDADTLDGISSGSFLRSDTADVAYGVITFNTYSTFQGGAYAVNIAGGSDIRFASGNWTGEHSGKIQYHSNIFYFQSYNGWYFRDSAGNNKAYIDSTGKITAPNTVKAWATCNTSGSSQAQGTVFPHTGVNVASCVKNNNLGRYVINFSTALSSASYSVTCSSSLVNTTAEVIQKSTGGFIVQHSRGSGGSLAAVNVASFDVIVCGL